MQPLLTLRTLPGYIYWVIDHGKPVCTGARALLYNSTAQWGPERLRDLYGVDVPSPAAFDAMDDVPSGPVPSDFNFGAFRQRAPTWPPGSGRASSSSSASS